MSGGSGEEWEGMLGLVWGIERYCFCRVEMWRCGLLGRGGEKGVEVVTTL